MAKKKFLDRISETLGLYDPDDPERDLEEEEEDEEEEPVEKPVKKEFPKAVRRAPITPVREEEPAPVKEEKEKKPGLLSRVNGAAVQGAEKQKGKPYHPDEDYNGSAGGGHRTGEL